LSIKLDYLELLRQINLVGPLWTVAAKDRKEWEMSIISKWNVDKEKDLFGNGWVSC